MQLQRIRIPVFRNLRELDITFDSHLQPTMGAPAEVHAQPIRGHALIGQNGTGKSNLIEALITIFRDVDLDREATSTTRWSTAFAVMACASRPIPPSKNARMCGWMEKPSLRDIC